MAVMGDRAVWRAEAEGLKVVSLTIGELLDRQAAAMPDKEALVYAYPERCLELRLNFREYRDQVDRVARGLLALGIGQGEHVAIWAPNLPEWIFLQLALYRIGAVLVTINTGYRAGELEYVLRQGDVTTLCMVEEFRGNSYLDSIHAIAPELREVADPVHEEVHSSALPCLKRVILIGGVERPGTLPFARLLQLGEAMPSVASAERAARVTPDDVALIMYTSGTTGFPKGAMLTHANLTSSVHLIGRGEDYSADRYVNPMPFFHIAGSNLVLFTLMNGMTHIPAITFDVDKVLDLLEHERGSLLFCVPTMVVALLNHPRFLAGAVDLTSLRQLFAAGAPVPVALMEEVKERLGADSKIPYGLTEAAGAGTVTLDGDTFALKSSTVGKPYPHLDVQIVDPLTRAVVRCGERGELLMRGAPVMCGYYNMPEKTAEAIDEQGWLHTGDMATMDRQGYVNIVGRRAEMIIRGGENLYPVEIEQFLIRHPAVAEAQVVGVPDPYMGEELVALLHLRTGMITNEEEVRAYCRAGISRYKTPKHIRFVDSYPLTASGKVKKYELRAQLIAELGLEEAAVIRTA